MPGVLFDTARGEKVRFAARDFKNVRIYTCGPTVHAQQHLGDLRAYVVVDVLKRRLLAQGAGIRHVISITDVGHLTDDADSGEDKVERAARRQRRTVAQTAERFTNLFRRDLALLGVLTPNVWARASEHIEQQIEMAQALETRGFAYRTQDGLYFDTSKDLYYGRFARAGAPQIPAKLGLVAVDKRRRADFVLWKRSSDTSRRQQAWDSPWGRGFPGWHIECSAMASAHLGAQIDVHTGTVDHIHAHHENEIAQSENALGVSQWVRQWLHVEWLTVPTRGNAREAGSGLDLTSSKAEPPLGFEKMSKWRHNTASLDEVIASGAAPRAFRLLLLCTHYREKLEFTWAALAAKARFYERLVARIAELHEPHEASSNTAEAAALRRAFVGAMDDDLDTPKALSILWDALEHPRLTDADKLTLVRNFDDVLGLDLLEAAALESLPRASPSLTPPVMHLLERRIAARAARDFALADALRVQLRRLGFDLRDHSDGSHIRAAEGRAQEPFARSVGKAG